MLWSIWYGFQSIDAAGLHWRRHEVPHLIFLMLLLPLGAPIAFTVIVWIADGFRSPPRSKQEPRIATAEDTDTVSRTQISDYSRPPRPIVRRIQKDAPKRNLQSLERRGSTALLVLSIFFPTWWEFDFTCMSVYWVARLPRDLWTENLHKISMPAASGGKGLFKGRSL